MAKRPTKKNSKTIETLTHDEAKRTNIPTAEYQSLVQENLEQVSVTYKRGDEALKEEKATRDHDQDPQLVWRGKDQQDWSDLVVNAPPLYIQEKVHPKTLIDDLRNRSINDEKEQEPQVDLFADFNGLPDEGAKTEFYQHDAHWSNRMILGDSLQVMASLAEREGLRGKVQCIYFDPPYGIKFNSNFQWSTNNRDVKDGKAESITREPETVKAFRDTWKDGVNSYLSYLRDRLTVGRDLLTESGSIFLQIGDENIHLIRVLLDEIFGNDNYLTTINFATTGGLPSSHLSRIGDYILVYAKNRELVKWRKLFEEKKGFGDQGSGYSRLQLAPFHRRSATSDEKNDPSLLDASWKIYTSDNLNGQGPPSQPTPFEFNGRSFNPAANSHWKPNYPKGLQSLAKADRIEVVGKNLRYVRFFEDSPLSPIKNIWLDTSKAGFASQKVYVVETNAAVIQRCILMASDPGDLILDPTCGSATTAFVAEQWGRRWITIDTSRVALALARSRVMGAKYSYYLLADSSEGKHKEAELDLTGPSSRATHNDLRQGFVYRRVPHIRLSSIANNAEIETIWDTYTEKLEPLRCQLNEFLNEDWAEWEAPRQAGEDWSDEAIDLHKLWWKLRFDRQTEIDASIAAQSDYEDLFDQPFEDKTKVRVAGPFTVESLSPHRSLGVDENDDLIDSVMDSAGGYGEAQPFVQMILENLKTAGVQQAHKEDKINFSSLVPWPGRMICAEGQYSEDENEGGDLKRAAIFVGPEFGTVSRPDLVQAAREAADAEFDVLVACAFNYDALSTEFDTLGSLPVLKARMNADLHMAEDLKNTGKGNLFVIFGEPDIDLLEADDGKVQVKINGVDVFHPNSGEVRSDGADGIACWFVDTDYNEESFFVRQAYFLGANDPYKSLKTTLKAEINEDAWATLNSDISVPFAKPSSGRIAVKVINHLGDEVMKVYRVD